MSSPVTAFTSPLKTAELKPYLKKSHRINNETFELRHMDITQLDEIKLSGSIGQINVVTNQPNDLTYVYIFVNPFLSEAIIQVILFEIAALGLLFLVRDFIEVINQ